MDEAVPTEVYLAAIEPLNNIELDPEEDQRIYEVIRATWEASRDRFIEALAELWSGQE